MEATPRTHRTASRRRELPVGSFARLDLDRPRRTGIPEVILAEGKTTEHLIAVLRELSRTGRGGLVSRPTRAQARSLERARRDGLPIELLAAGRVARLAGPIGSDPVTGVAAVVTAGTADVPVAEECRVVLETLGVATTTAYDVGVAGLHRLQRAIRNLERRHPSIYLVFAGREGALPTVVAGLVRAPVIGVPTSVGYGKGGRGHGALTAMLQSCAALAVVNIDGAVPAALFAVQLLRSAEDLRVRGGHRAHPLKGLGPPP